MTAALLTMLFVFSGAFAVAAIIGCLRQYGHAAIAISRHAGEVPPTREVRVTTRLIEVRSVATILRPDFSSPRQTPPAALPVAA